MIYVYIYMYIDGILIFDYIHRYNIHRCNIHIYVGGILTFDYYRYIHRWNNYKGIYIKSSWLKLKDISLYLRTKAKHLLFKNCS